MIGDIFHRKGRKVRKGKKNVEGYLAFLCALRGETPFF